jgi:TonB-linked SusC/RagA family outer membrane protein
MGISRPMILVDGVEIDVSTFEAGSSDDLSDRFADIDFSAIERVEVVKGAAAATLYGAQGANGVIQIFTKAGRAGDMQVSASTSWSFDQLDESRLVEQNTNFHSFPVDEDGNIIGMSFNENTGVWTLPSQEPSGVTDNPYHGYISPDGEVIPLIVQDDRIANFYETTATQSHNLSISGGNERSTYLISGNFLNQDGIEPGTGFDRLSFRVNTDTKLLDNLRVSLRSNYINSDQFGVTESGDNVQSGLNTLLTTEPFIDVFRRNPNGQFPGKFTAGDVSTNPFFFKDIQSLGTETNRLIGNINVNYTPIRFLELDYRFGVDYYYSQFDRIQKNGQGFEDPTTAETEIVLLQPDGLVERVGRTNFMFNSIMDATVRTDFQRDFNINLPIQSTTLFKFDWRRTDFQATTAEGTNLPFGIDLTTLRATSNPTIDEFKSEFVTFGFLVNQKFDYGDLFGISGGFRADKSSAFGEAAEYSYFPRADAYIRVSSFDFWNPIGGTFSEFKLRGAYGEAGTQPGAFSRFITLQQGLVGSQGTFKTADPASNPLLAVEESQEFEAGADIALTFAGNWFQSFGISGTYWNRENNGAIQQIETAPSTGATSILNNAIDLASEGVDISLNSLVHYNQNWNWRANVNFGTSKTTVEGIGNNEDLVLEPTNAFRYLFREGETFGAFFGFNPLQSIDEIDPTTGERYIPEANADNFVLVDGAVVNRFNKQIQFRSEQEKIGDPTPDFTISFRNDFQIKKNFDVAFQIDWTQGGDIFNATKWWMFNAGIHEEFEEKVLIDGGETVDNPMFDADGNPTSTLSTVDGNAPQAWRNYHASKRQEATPYFVEDGTNVKLREVSLSYDFSDLIGFSGIRSLRFGVSGRNLLTFTGYDGFDPEVSGEDQDVRFRGLDIFTYPNYRTFTFTASVDF